MLLEDKDKPHRDLKSLWMVPILALGVGTFIATRKQLAPSHERPKRFTAQMMRTEAYDQAKELMMHQSMESNPISVVGIRYVSYTQDAVTDLGRGRFRCSSRFMGRSRTGITMQQRWQCIVLEHHGYWMCEDAQQTPWEQVSPGLKKRGTVVVEKAQH